MAAGHVAHEPSGHCRCAICGEWLCCKSLIVCDLQRKHHERGTLFVRLSVCMSMNTKDMGWV